MLFPAAFLFYRSETLGIVLCDECVDLVRRIEYGADGDIVIQGIDNNCHKLAHISFDEIRAVVDLRRQIGQIRRDQAIDISGSVIIVELLKPFGEETERRTDEDTGSTPVLDLPCNIEHTFTGCNHIVYDDSGLALDIIAQEFVGYDRVLAVDNGGIIPSLIEHPHIHTKDIGEVNGTRCIAPSSGLIIIR